MKIKASTTDLEMSLMKAAGTIALRLKQMVIGFSYEFTLKASNQTPIGDLGKFEALYNKRITDSNWESYGLNPEPGFAKGSWRASMSAKPTLQEFYGENSTQQAADKVKLDMSNYLLGKKVYIMNSGPYITILENRYGSNGIMGHTLKNVMSAHSVELKRYYDQPL